MHISLDAVYRVRW